MVPRPVLRHYFTIAGQGVAGIDLRRSNAAIHISKAATQRMDGLNCRRCELSEKFDQVRAPVHAAETSTQLGAKSDLNAQSDQALKVRRDRWAYPVRSSIDARVDTVNQQRIVDRDTERYVMKQVSSIQCTMVVPQGVALPVRHPSFDIPQAVVPAVAAARDLSCVHQLARRG
jgi:hypothetical protein